MHALTGEVLAGAPINPGHGTARERGASRQAENRIKKEDKIAARKTSPPSSKTARESPGASLGVPGLALAPLS